MNRKISLSGFDMKIAGSIDGQVVLIAGPSVFASHNEKINIAYELVKRELFKTTSNSSQHVPLRGWDRFAVM